MKNFLTLVLTLMFLCFVSFLFTYGYEEGTMRVKEIGLVAQHVFLIFKYPFNFQMAHTPVFISLTLSILGYSFVLFMIVVFIDRFFVKKIN